MKQVARGKFYGDNRAQLQRVADRLLNEFAPRCSVSEILPSKEGDFHIFVTIFEEAGR